jgi:hypothetical protein
VRSWWPKLAEVAWHQWGDEFGWRWRRSRRWWSFGVQQQLPVDPVAQVGREGGLADRGLKKNDMRRCPPQQWRRRRFIARCRCGGGFAVAGSWIDCVEGQQGRHQGAWAEGESTQGRERRRVPAVPSCRGREEKWGRLARAHAGKRRGRCTTRRRGKGGSGQPAGAGSTVWQCAQEGNRGGGAWADPRRRENGRAHEE